ncbi:MAG: hypothetical protein HY721_18695 [Planctomycetes bacterium]|nr:hypothetical protein [Planctomycetota bacterium]
MLPGRLRGGAGDRKKVALIATEVRKYSHAQHFIDRFLEGYGWHGRHHRPPVDLVSLYVDQFPEGDLSRDRERRHGVKIHPTIAEALTLGTSRLAVDGVVIIGEHGSYPSNALGQRLYPRYRFFKEVVKVFEASGRSAPVFNDKHLSTDWKECVEMVEDSRRLGFAFLAGSSLPVTWRIPSIEMPLGTPLEESVCVCYGGVDSYDFHGLETAQCMSERREGGEAGVRSVHAARGEKVWTLLAGRETTLRLVLASLARSHTLAPPPGYSYPVLSAEYVRRACAQATGSVGYFIEHLDGLRTTLLLLNGFVLDFNYAGKVKARAGAKGSEGSQGSQGSQGSGRIISCQMYLPMPPRQTTLADFFNPLVNNIEETIVTGKATYPVERTLLTSGMTLFGVESLYRGEVPLLTPELKVAYAAPERSAYWRA